MKPIEPVTIFLDKERTVVLDMAALMRAERIINKQRREDGLEPASIFRLMDDFLTDARDVNVSAQFVCILLWAALAGEDPGLSVDDVAKMIRSPLPVIAKILESMRAYFSSSNADEEEAGKADPPLDQPNGLASGPLPESS